LGAAEKKTMRAIVNSNTYETSLIWYKNCLIFLKFGRIIKTTKTAINGKSIYSIVVASRPFFSAEPVVLNNKIKITIAKNDIINIIG
jgi:hypothetical protein